MHIHASIFTHTYIHTYTQVRKPNSPDYYSESDLFLGSRLVAFSRRFVIVDADEYTIRYMEAHPDEFPCSQKEAVMSRLMVRFVSRLFGENNIRRCLLDILVIPI